MICLSSSYGDSKNKKKHQIWLDPQFSILTHQTDSSKAYNIWLMYPSMQQPSHKECKKQ